MLTLRREPRCCEKWRQVRRRTQVMASAGRVIPLPSPTTTAGAISRTTLRAGPVFTRCGVTRRLFGIPNFASRALPRVKTGAGAAADEMATDPSPQQQSLAVQFVRADVDCRRQVQRFDGTTARNRERPRVEGGQLLAGHAAGLVAE